jgi:hypothetical protein
MLGLLIRPVSEALGAPGIAGPGLINGFPGFGQTLGNFAMGQFQNLRAQYGDLEDPKAGLT